MPFGPTPTRDDYFTALRSFLLLILPPGIEIVQQQDNRVAQPDGADFVTMNEVGRRRLSTNVETYSDCTFVGTVSGASLTVAHVLIGAIEVGNRLLGAGVLTGTAIAAQSSGQPGKEGVYVLSVAQQTPIAGVPLATGAALIAQPTEVTVQVDVYGPASGENTTAATTLLRDGYSALWFQREGWAARGIGVLDVGEPRQMAFIDGESQYEDRFSFDVKMQTNLVTSPAQDFADAIRLTINVPGDLVPAGVDPATLSQGGVAVAAEDIDVCAADVGGGPVVALPRAVPTGVVSSGVAPTATPQSDVPATTGDANPRAAGNGGDYGFVSYGEAAGAAAMMFPAGVRTRLTFAPDPTRTIDELRGPFTGHTFWDGRTILPRATGDDAEIRLNVKISAFVIGGSVLADIDIGGAFGVIDNDNRVLIQPAGTPETVRFLFADYFLQTFVADGGAIYLTPSVPIAVTNESLVFYPRGAAP